MDKKQEVLFNYLLRLADTQLIHGQRLAEWCGHGPFLEEDLAITNIALDSIGQAQALYQYAAELQGLGKTEDDLVYFRNERNYYNALMAELPKGDFGFTILRAYLLSVFNFHTYKKLSISANERLKAIAAKAIKEVTYHVRHTSGWVVRLGDGTSESHQRMQTSLNELWRFTNDLFSMLEDEKELVNEGIIVDFTTIKPIWEKEVKEVLLQATLNIPQEDNQQLGSRKGIHTEYLGYILAEMQYLPRCYPEAKW